MVLWVRSIDMRLESDLSRPSVWGTGALVLYKCSASGWSIRRCSVGVKPLSLPTGNFSPWPPGSAPIRDANTSHTWGRSASGRAAWGIMTRR